MVDLLLSYGIVIGGAILLINLSRCIYHVMTKKENTSEAAQFDSDSMKMIEAFWQGIRILEEYGETLGKFDDKIIGLPESSLPYSKEIIGNTMKMVLLLLMDANFCENLKKTSNDDRTKYILSDEFYQLMKEGYVELAGILADADAGLFNSASDKIKALRINPDDPQAFKKLESIQGKFELIWKGYRAILERIEAEAKIRGSELAAVIELQKRNENLTLRTDIRL